MAERSTVVAVYGASGFVGGAVSEELARRGATLRAVTARGLRERRVSRDEIIAHLAEQVRGAGAVVNCAGNPDASSRDLDALMWVNGELPGLVAEAAARGGVQRYVHVSSAVVQGRKKVLDSSDEVEEVSPYARSKIMGERAVLASTLSHPVVYRPPSVHGPQRKVTQGIARIARSRWACVAAPGTQPTPQAHIESVARAIVCLALSPEAPPRIVHHPWEGLTVSSLMVALGGTNPHHLPAVAVKTAVFVLWQASAALPALKPIVRRVEMVLAGQKQADSWLSSRSEFRPASMEEWQALASDLKATRSGASARVVSRPPLMRALPTVVLRKLRLPPYRQVRPGAA